MLIGARKTQIALAYAFWLRETHPEVSVFWVHASNRERFRQAYSFIAQECQVPGYDDPKTDVLPLVKRWLERKDCGRWLMVIDNADDTQLFFGQQGECETDNTHQETLGRYLPECSHGAILVTTRNKQTGSRLTKGKRPIEVGRMNDDETAQLLHTRLDGVDAASGESSVLSSRLEHLPLALVQAAAFIQENSITISEYLRLLDKSDQHIVDLLSEQFETVGRDSETPRAVAEAWIISFDQIQRQTPLAGELLSLMSLLDRQGIPLEFLSRYSERQPGQEARGNVQLTKALGVLKAFSFVTEDQGHRFDMHRLVQLVTRKWLARNGKGHWFTEQAILAVSQAYPFGDHENRTTCSAYLPHVHAVLRYEGTGSEDERLARASLLHCAAGFFSYQGQWKDAEKFQLQARELRREVLGLEHPDTLTSMASLASTYRNQGRWKEAESLFVQVIETRKRVPVLGEEHPSTLASIANLASTYRNQGRWKEAEATELQAIEIKKRVLGEEHPETLTSIANLASIYQKQGRWKESEELQAKELDICSRVLGEEHPSTLTSIANLASIYWNQGRWKEAELLDIQVIETRKRVLGEGHPDTLTSIANLASTFWKQGRWKEAELLDIQVMEIRKRLLGEEHPSTLTSMANLASTFWKQGRWREAELLDIQVIETIKRVLGEEHPSTLTSMANLASTYQSQGRWKEAELLEVQVMETRKRILGEHPSTLTSMANLASLYWKQGRWKEAELLFVQVVETRKRVLGEEHPDTLTSMANLAHTWKCQGRLGDALDLMKTCCHHQQQVLGRDHPDTVSTLSVLKEWQEQEGNTSFRAITGRAERWLSFG
jgi:tetratricopeptide (TPR) repeat protein